MNALCKKKNEEKMLPTQKEITAMYILFFVCFVCFVALCPQSTIMVMAGQTVHLTTLFPGQA